MALPTSYMTGSFTKIPQYFDTMLTAKAPDKFTTKFMADLGFTSSNDRQFVNVLKAIGFLDDSGTPTERYFKFLDQSFSKQMVAEGIKEAYADLFALNTSANKMTKAEVEGKFKTLTNGSKENATIKTNMERAPVKRMVVVRTINCFCGPVVCGRLDVCDSVYLLRTGRI